MTAGVGPTRIDLSARQRPRNRAAAMPVGGSMPAADGSVRTLTVEAGVSPARRAERASRRRRLAPPGGRDARRHRFCL